MENAATLSALVTQRSGPEVQAFHELVPRPLGLSRREPVVEALNPVLADLLTLRDLYKKHHWQVSGPEFLELHRLFDEHHDRLSELIDEVGERIRILGGIGIAMGADAAELTRIPRPPRGRESTCGQIRRLVQGHEVLLKGVREAAMVADRSGDLGTNDLLVSGVLRTSEMQVWFLVEHLGEGLSGQSIRD